VPGPICWRPAPRQPTRIACGGFRILAARLHRLGRRERVTVSWRRPGPAGAETGG
jgi:hypothetical protein